MTEKSKTRTWIFRIIMLLLILCFSEVSAYLTLKLAGRFNVQYWPIPPDSLYEADQKAIQSLIEESKKNYIIHHPQLGWTIRPHATSADGKFRSNAQGIRGDREYSKAPTEGKLRITAYGDSFTHCDEVSNAETWETQLEKFDPKLEVLNLGVGGYGPDQAYLRYGVEKESFKSQIVFLGFMSENLNRVVNVFRAFYTPMGSPLAKPRFKAGSGPYQLELVANPLPQLADYEALLRSPREKILEMGREDYWYHLMPHQSCWDSIATVRLFKTAKFWFDRALAPSSLIRPDGVYRNHSEALRIVEGVFEKFYQDVTRDQATPVIVLFPSHRDILRHRKSGKKRYQVLIDFLNAKGYRFIDLLDGFDRLRGSYQDGPLLGHYTPEENRVVAQSILHSMKEMGLLGK